MGVVQKVSELATDGGLCLVVGPANAKWEAKAMRRVADELWAGSRQAIGLTSDRAIFRGHLWEVLWEHGRACSDNHREDIDFIGDSWRMGRPLMRVRIPYP